MTLWTASQAAAATSGTLSGHQDWQAHGISIDSRSLQPGDLFIALVGEQQNGHHYVANALANGAAAAVVSTLPEGLPADAPLIQVHNTTRALEDLGRAARARFRGKVIGITGSVGKTSTKEMLAQAFTTAGLTHATQGNLNNHYGVPLTLARLPQNADFAIIEMGMNHAGEIAALTRQARPHVAIITAVAAVHLEFFPSVEAIADAKAEIFEGLEAGGHAILPADSPYFQQLHDSALRAGAAHLMQFGQAPRADSHLLAYQSNGQDSMATAVVNNHQLTFHLPQPGAHFAINACAVLAAVAACGEDVARAADALSRTRMSDGRGNLLQLEDGQRHITLIHDAYNASPISMQAAFSAFRLRNGTRHIAVLGDMLELGEQAPHLHAALARHPDLLTCDAVVTIGTLMQHLHRALPPTLAATHCATLQEAATYLHATLQDGDCVLLKGSHGSKLYQLPDLLHPLFTRKAG